MKIIITNKSQMAIPYMSRCDGEKVGYIYRLPPGDRLECNALHTHKAGLILTSLYDAIYSISYDDFPHLQITYEPR